MKKAVVLIILVVLVTLMAVTVVSAASLRSSDVPGVGDLDRDPGDGWTLDDPPEDGGGSDGDFEFIANDPNAGCPPKSADGVRYRPICLFR